MEYKNDDTLFYSGELINDTKIINFDTGVEYDVESDHDAKIIAYFHPWIIVQVTSDKLVNRGDFILYKIEFENNIPKRAKNIEYIIDIKYTSAHINQIYVFGYVWTGPEPYALLHSLNDIDYTIIGCNRSCRSPLQIDYNNDKIIYKIDEDTFILPYTSWKVKKLDIKSAMKI